jgi:hypothetical protein
MADRSDLSLSRRARERFQALLEAIGDSETEHELMTHIEQFFNFQVEIRQYFSLIEREIVDKLRELRGVGEIEQKSARLLPPGDLSARRERNQNRHE